MYKLLLSYVADSDISTYITAHITFQRKYNIHIPLLCFLYKILPSDIWDTSLEEVLLSCLFSVLGSKWYGFCW